MPVSLSIVTPALVAATRRARDAAEARWSAVPGVSFSAVGSSAHAGTLSRGDIDLLVRVPQASRGLLLRLLDAACARAQLGNWTETFASFTCHDLAEMPVGLQVVTCDSADDHMLGAQTAALDDPSIRSAYDAAKVHGAPLGPAGYWRVKDFFWRTLGRGPRWGVPSAPVLEVLRTPELEALIARGVIEGAPVDVADGYVHLSAPHQVDETVARHFAGERDLWLLHLDAAQLGPALRWELSRRGEPFPHLYAPLSLVDLALARPWAADAPP